MNGFQWCIVGLGTGFWIGFCVWVDAWAEYLKSHGKESDGD